MQLILPSQKYYQSYLDAINEYKANDIQTYDFLDVSQQDIFQQIEDFRLGHNLPKNYVQGTYLWLVKDNEFIGEISIRHTLTDALLRYGGNIGYAIRYSKWHKGLGTMMLSKALIYANEIVGLHKVLITCNDDNIGSVKVIEKNGGVLQDKIENEINGAAIVTRRYWIHLLN